MRRGATLGAGASVGCRATIHPGAAVGVGSRIGDYNSVKAGVRTRPGTVVPERDWLDPEKRALMPLATSNAEAIDGEVVDQDHPAAATPREASSTRWMGEQEHADLLERVPGISKTVLVDVDATIMAGARIAAGAKIRAGAQVQADAEIGAGADIGYDASVESGARVGDDVKVGAGTAIEQDARIGDAAAIGEDVRVAKEATVPPKAEIEARATVLAREPWVIPPQPPAPMVEIGQAAGPPEHQPTERGGRDTEPAREHQPAR